MLFDRSEAPNALILGALKSEYPLYFLTDHINSATMS